MIHKPIQIRELSLSLPHKNCFEDFSATIRYGDRIAIIGRNGSGKSSLLKMLLGINEPTYGEINVPQDVEFGYVPQIIVDFKDKSGGQRFQKSLNDALSNSPSILLLDEPTNHLDQSNRKSLMRMINGFEGTILAVSHDKELLRNCFNTFWHIDDSNIHQFTGSFDDYTRERDIERGKVLGKLATLDKEKRDVHISLMKEQKRSSTSKAKGQKSIEQRRWPTIVSRAKANQAACTTGRKKAEIRGKREDVLEQLKNLRAPEEIKAKFSITAADCNNGNVISIKNGAVGYKDFILKNINLYVNGTERVAISGDNGSGKSTLIKAIMHSEDVRRDGEWYVPKPEEVGYLDQHYSVLNEDETVFDVISNLISYWGDREVRSHLNDFLFRKNEEVEMLVKNLSGGEKARLSLACIAAKTPKILILDEITNNLDMETVEHVIQVINDYPGAVLVIAHDEDFLEKIGVTSRYQVCHGSIEKLK